MVEGLGYLASLITVISFLMKNVKVLRVINLIACVMFVIYGSYKQDYPIFFVNFIVGTINAYYIYLKN